MGQLASPDGYRLLINGDWVEGGNGTYPIVNPATEEVASQAPEASVADAEQAARAAREAWPGWSATPPAERARLLQATADALRREAPDLVPLIISETGATLSVGSALQVPQAYARFDRYARAALSDMTIPLPPQEIGTTPLAPGGLMGAVA